MPEKYGPKQDDEEEDLTEDPMGLASLQQLDELEDEFNDDDALQKYRQQRLDELKEERLKNCFGDVRLIDKSEWTKEVNDSSHNNWVIVHLFQDSKVECQLMDEAINELALKFKYIKFVRIKSTSAIENWPDANLPTLFMYNEGEAKDQIMTLKSLGGKTMKPIDLEWALVQKDVITDSELQDDPRSEQSQMEKRLAEEEDNNGNRYSPSKGGHRNIRRSDRFWDDSDEEDDNV